MPMSVPARMPPMAQPPRAMPDAHITQLKEMFPTMDEEILRAVLMSKGGNVDDAITELLSMQ